MSSVLLETTSTRQPRDPAPFDEDFVRSYQRQTYGGTHMHGYLRRRSEALASVVAEYARLLSRPLRILEVACGPGLSLSALQLAEPAHRMFGIDRSWEMLRLAGRNTGSAGRTPGLSHASALQLPFRDEAFDVVYATRFVHMFRDKAPVMRELRRVLRQPGAMIVEFYNRPYHVARYVAQRPAVPFDEYLYHFPAFREVRSLVGGKARFIPLRFGGERWLHAMIGERRVRRFLDTAWSRPLRPFIDEYFAVVDSRDLA